MGFRIKPKTDSDRHKAIKPKIVGEIRKSQIITTYGPGSLIDFPRMSAILDGIDYWESSLGKHNFDKMKIHERNLEKILGKKFFVQPQMIEDKNIVNGINARRFPEYCYCPECGVLDKYYKIEKKKSSTSQYNNDSFCGICNQTKSRNIKLIPSRFVVACKCGHIDDFPYEWWVHRKKGKCSNPKLSVSISKTTNSLEGIVIKCQCGAEESLEGIMDKGALHQLRCYGKMPWLGKSEDSRSWYTNLQQGEYCEEELRVLQRGANNVYYPKIISALTIPPYSSRIQRILADNIDTLESYSDMPDELKNANLKYFYEKNVERLKCDELQFRYELDYALGHVNDGYTGLQDLIKGEYDALCDEDCKDPDFLTIDSEVPYELAQYIEMVKIVGRLREVQVLEGFWRISPEDAILSPLSTKPLSWLPGNELYGEGIFIKLDKDAVCQWEEKNYKRYKPLVEKAKNNYIAIKKIGSGNIRYILLHTLSHVIIRELTTQCGYTSASLKEKIYSSKNDRKDMCGILIYTASSDSDGSLGGLARQGVTDKLRDIILSALEEASWCSNDPICIDSLRQGYAGLNYAACHACALLPETSCECSNILLDRGALIGTSEDTSFGFFSDLLK